MKHGSLISLVSDSCVLACDMAIPPESYMAVSICPDWILLSANSIFSKKKTEERDCVSIMFKNPAIDVKHALSYI